MKLVHKVMDFDIGRVDEDERTFWAVASTDQVDRQGDSIDPAGWLLNNFLKNPVIPWAHDYNRPPVAKALLVKVQGGSLVFQAQFPRPEEYAFADTIFKLYRGGYLRAFSVGFSPLDSQVATHEINGKLVTGTRFLKQELYEISCVTLPANPEALVALGLANGNSDLYKTQASTLTPHANPLSKEQPSPAELKAARLALVRKTLDRLIAGRLCYHLGEKR